MNNSHDEIKKLLKASRNMFSSEQLVRESKDIKKKYNILTEEDDLINTNKNTISKIDPAQSVEKSIDDKKENPKDKKQGYRISGGIMVLHGKNQTELELTTDEKIAFQETMDEFVSEVSDLVDFNKLNVYQNNVEWSGKIVDFDVEFFISIGEENGMYLNGNMMKVDDKFLELQNKLKAYYEKFKSRWAKILASRKKTKKIEE